MGLQRVGHNNNKRDPRLLASQTFHSGEENGVGVATWAGGQAGSLPIPASSRQACGEASRSPEGGQLRPQARHLSSHKVWQRATRLPSQTAKRRRLFSSEEFLPSATGLFPDSPNIGAGRGFLRSANGTFSCVGRRGRSPKTGRCK